MELKTFEADDWTKIYSGEWSLLSSSHFGDEYTKEIRFGERPFISKSIITIQHGKSSGWARQSDRDLLGHNLSNEVKESPKRVEEICDLLKEQADSIRSFIDEHEKGEIDLAIYEDFWSRVITYYQPHINVKYIVDYLEPKLLEKYLPIFEGARTYAENVLDRTEDFVNSVAIQVGLSSEYPTELCLCLMKDEVYEYFRNKLLPQKNVLAERNESAAIVADEEDLELLVGSEVSKIEDIVTRKLEEGIVKGNTAYGGKVEGIAKIVHNPADASHFNDGDILIAGMTRPEYLSLMKRASAFVTDAGGMLCHAAIVARELKKPCIISTQVASEIFKNGDHIEVDATNGIVRKL